MKNRIKHIVIGAVALVLLTTPVPPVAAETEPTEDRWKFVGEIYLWGAAVNGESAAGDDFEITFSDIMDNLDMAAMGKLAAVKGKWSLVGDFIYLDIEEDIRGTANIIGHPESTRGDVGLTAYIATLLGGYTVVETDSARVDVLLGTRYLDLEVNVEFDLGAFKTKLSDSGHNWDGIVGLTGRINLTPKWFLSCYADVGGGDSELTWQVQGLAGYRFGAFDAVFGYRYLDYEFDDPELIDNLNISGPFAGIRYHF